MLLIDAAKRALQASLQVPTHGVVVHAKDAEGLLRVREDLRHDRAATLSADTPSPIEEVGRWSGISVVIGTGKFAVDGDEMPRVQIVRLALESVGERTPSRGIAQSEAAAQTEGEPARPKTSVIKRLAMPGGINSAARACRRSSVTRQATCPPPNTVHRWTRSQASGACTRLHEASEQHIEAAPGVDRVVDRLLGEFDTDTLQARRLAVERDGVEVLYLLSLSINSWMVSSSHRPDRRRARCGLTSPA